MEIKYQSPCFTGQDACRFVNDLYGFKVTANPLPAERDQNFRVSTEAGRTFVFKIANATENRDILELQNALLEHLAQKAPALSLPRVCYTNKDESITTVKAPDGTSHLVRMLTFVPGSLWAQVTPHAPELLYSLGEVLGTMDAALSGFIHPAAQREFKWDLAHAGWIREYVQLIENHDHRVIVEKCIDRYEKTAKPLFPVLRRSVIYNDANDYNILVSDDDPRTRKVTGVIDFGDVVNTYTVCELAIASAYAAMGWIDPLRAVTHIIKGYHQRLPLTEHELEALFPLICIRLCITVVNAALQRKVNPENEYLSISEKPAWALLEKFAEIDPRYALYTFRYACGFPPCPTAHNVISWLAENRDKTGSILDMKLTSANKVIFDFSIKSLELGTISDIHNMGRLTDKLSSRMSSENAVVGIGKYNEARLFYTTDIFKTQGDNGPQWRTIHLGVDLFMKAGSSVFTPFDGIVHSFRINDNTLDYGPTIVLQHAAQDGIVFYTLYGHLSKDSVAGLSEGKRFVRGDCIGKIGGIEENGGWPPHVHFQIINDMLGKKGDFPGVALPDEREVWLSLCPDPNLILGLPPELFKDDRLTQEQILGIRRERIGRNLSISYTKPLTIVRGYMQHLYDVNGRTYLDCVNNVPHVGHCHPHVVKAGVSQMAVLNTNSRYLHENMIRYAQRLCSKLPKQLSVCYFVCSGSEANELALRLARTRTRSRETIVLDGAYHGNTSSLIDISPYKHDGPGGFGPPPYVHKIPTPDVFRGCYKRNVPTAAHKYAEYAADVIKQIGQRGCRVSAFICEPFLSCAGQIVLPDGYLKEVYAHVRKAGGVCIADEVQVGFGRVGSHFWAFETQGVIPDIVTLGKPIGNGHPLAAVVTTPEIADSFNNGMEYFNTFGGNPVSCAIGMAVLDVIEQEHLQEHALEVGNHLMNGLRRLMDTYQIIGDVRGLGLFLGFELVLDRTTLEPAADQATYLVNRAKEHGILISTDGPLHNVIKIKPPLAFTRDDADFVVNTLDKVLQEDFLCV